MYNNSILYNGCIDVICTPYQGLLLGLKGLNTMIILSVYQGSNYIKILRCLKNICEIY